MSTPTKAQEIEILDTAIEELGNGSYIGPFLRSVRAELIQCIQSDIFPEIDVRETEKQCKRLIQQARDRADDEAENILNVATLEAQRERQRAERLRSSILDALASARRELLGE